MNTVKTRTATLEDLPILLEFEQGIIIAERPLDPTLKAGHFSYYDLEAYVKSSDTEVVVALDGEEVIGSGYVKIKQTEPYHTFEKYGYIGFMYVKPDHRGKGIVGVITDALVSWAKSQGITEVRLDVYADNASAVRAYEKSGFTKNLIEMRMDLS